MLRSQFTSFIAQSDIKMEILHQPYSVGNLCCRRSIWEYLLISTKSLL